MNKIKELLDKAACAYYAGDPILSDEQFDALAESIGYSSVGAKQHENVEKHFYPMYSLQKFYEDENKDSPLKGYKDISITPKLDGAALDLLYVNCQLIRALTRGDGIEGKVVTDKFLLSNKVPKRINVGGIVQVVGEIAAPKHIENSRNYAAGALNLKDPAEFVTRAVEFFAYGVTGLSNTTFNGDMSELKQMGFSTVQDKNLAEVYPTDGLVFRLNNNAEFLAAGFTAQFPRGAYAKKERGVAVETTLLDVIWQVGKSGKVTPVAILEPVLVGDALVSRATLNNQEFIETLDIQIGDRVAIVRAGEIIPQILHKVGG